jgi:glycosyltransferase involved in cell wall biosynthesis
MKIAILAPYVGNFVGGLETAAMSLREQLSLSHNCMIFSFSDTEGTIRIPGMSRPKFPTLVSSLRLFYLNHFIPYMYIIKNNAFAEFRYSYNLFPILQRFEPDVIINFTYSILSLFCKYYRHRFKVPFLSVGQSGCTYMEVKSAMTKPDAYVALTPLAKKFIENRVSGVHVEVIPNGVDMSCFSPNGPKFSLSGYLSKSGFSHMDLTPPLILSTSRIVKEKRLDLLIKAVSHLEKGTLILAGHGEEKQKLIDFGNKVLKNRILFLDTLKKEELADLYRSCDVFSIPSQNEAFGNVVIEAMASGLPVVATGDEGFRWMLGKKGGILVDVTNSQEYAAALRKAYEDDFRDGPVKEAQRFSWEKVTNAYIELMEKVTKQKKDR